MTTPRRRTSLRRTSDRLRRNTSPGEGTSRGNVFVHYRAARTVASRALKACGIWHSYMSRAEAEGTPRYVTWGTPAQYRAFDAYLDALPPFDRHGIEGYY